MIDTVSLYANLGRGRNGELVEWSISRIILADSLLSVYLHENLQTKFVTDFFYQHRVAFDGATSEVEVLDTCGCAVSVTFICFKCWHSFVFMAR